MAKLEHRLNGYAVLEERSGQIMFFDGFQNGPMAGIFLSLKRAHKYAKIGHGVVVRCNVIETDNEPIGANGKRLKR